MYVGTWSMWSTYVPDIRRFYEAPSESISEFTEYCKSQFQKSAVQFQFRSWCHDLVYFQIKFPDVCFVKRSSHRIITQTCIPKCKQSKQKGYIHVVTACFCYIMYSPCIARTGIHINILYGFTDDHPLYSSRANEINPDVQSRGRISVICEAPR